MPTPVHAIRKYGIVADPQGRSLRAVANRGMGLVQVSYKDKGGERFMYFAGDDARAFAVRLIEEAKKADDIAAAKAAEKKKSD